MSPIHQKLRSRVFIEIVSAISLVVAWWLVSLFSIPRYIPSPLSVFYLVIANFANGSAPFHIYKTLTRVIVGFFASLGIGIALGVLMGSKRVLEDYFKMLTVIALTIPSLCWAIFSVMWFGVAELVAYIPITMITFPIVTVRVWEGVKAVDKSLVDMARTFRVSRLHIIRKVYIPMLMPHILSSMRHSFATSWKIATIVEVFGLSNGVGYMLSYYYRELYVAQLFAWAIIFVVIMIFVERFAFSEISKRAFKWRPETRL